MAVDGEERTFLRPIRLSPGDTIAITTPSGPAVYLQRLKRGVLALEKLGFRVVVGPMAHVNGFDERTPQSRAEELNGFLRDRPVRALLTSIGGHNSNALLDLIDWEALRSDPKPLVGYSDITALLSGAITQAGVIAFHGPTVLPEFAEYPHVQDYTANSFLQATTHDAPMGEIPFPERWTEEFLAWEKDDVRPRVSSPTQPPTWFGQGSAVGPLLGGNLETLCALIGTTYLPSFANAVVLLETVGTSLEALDRCLTHLRTATDISEMAGLVAGHTLRAGEGFQQRWDRHLRRTFGHLGVPLLLGAHVGHTDPMPTLPLGARVRLDADRRTLEVLDAAVF
ncbi:S66 peptidase family protein [Nocardiopsis sp. NPDC007018]|uniref:S66 peptidase family protein n=1 Tax=Nocardiopsis sp. NPDC007018 TaxID=3155721 RepID=UPI0033D64025